MDVTRYDAIVSKGGFAWQMFDDGPNLHVPLGKPIPSPDACAKKLRSEWCLDNSTADRRALRYGVLETDVLAQPTNLTAEFLLTRGDFAWLGYDFRGCKSVEYPRRVRYRPQSDADFRRPGHANTSILAMH